MATPGFNAPVPRGPFDKSGWALLLDWLAKFRDNLTSVKTPVAAAQNIYTDSYSIPRFAPIYWTVNGPPTQSFSVTSPVVRPGAYDLKVTVVSRQTDDFVGLIWDSVDKYDHVFLSYTTNTNYTGEVLNFTIQTTGAILAVNDPIHPITLTIEGFDANGNSGTWFVGLLAYASLIAGTKYSVSLDFSAIGTALNIPVANITRMFLGFVTTSYNPASTTPLVANESGTVLITFTGGAGQSQLVQQRIRNFPTQLGISHGYDDSYNQNPIRLLDNGYQLGYRYWIDLYIGMSHFFDPLWNAGQGKYLIQSAGPLILNAATRDWWSIFLGYATTLGYNVQQSLSFELQAQRADTSWAQLEFSGTISQTGYTPPSFLVSPSIAAGQNFLKATYNDMNDIAVAAGAPVFMQVGEPWWWWNSASRKPCIYDAQTKADFLAANPGHSVVDVGTIDRSLSSLSADGQLYVNFCQNRLGTSVLALRTSIQAHNAAAKVCVLFFLPSILGQISVVPGGSSYVATLNYPKTQYSFPNLDFFTTETYDWVIAGSLDLNYRAMTLPLYELNYPATQVHYLAGFVPDTANAIDLNLVTGNNFRMNTWQRIVGTLANNRPYNPAAQYIWAYPQVMRDSITIYPHADYSSFFYNGANWYQAVRDDLNYGNTN